MAVMTLLLIGTPYGWWRRIAPQLYIGIFSSGMQLWGGWGTDLSVPRPLLAAWGVPSGPGSVLVDAC